MRARDVVIVILICMAVGGLLSGAIQAHAERQRVSNPAASAAREAHTTLDHLNLEVLDADCAHMNDEELRRHINELHEIIKVFTHQVESEAEASDTAAAVSIER